MNTNQQTERRNSTMLWFKDESVITHEDGTVTTAAPIPTRAAKTVKVDSAKLAEAFRSSAELCQAISHVS